MLQEKKIYLILGGSLLLILALLSVSYPIWNSASPANNCAQCHKITHSFDLWARSAHRNITCKECHGTALSEGMHSLKKKAEILFQHNRKFRAEDIHITENQRMELMLRCIGCHQAEYARWHSGGHAISYADILLNKIHNKAIVPHDDCFRCHGLFFDRVTVKDIIEPLDTIGPWRLKIPAFGDRPAIPCFACHQVHQPGIPGMRQNLENPSALHYLRPEIFFTSFYSRRDRIYFPVSNLPVSKLNYRGISLKISDDPNQRLCTQCHAPNAFNVAGTGNDRTPRGVHEGLSCLACHDPHSNSARNSCRNCHPAISNCKLDVEQMNTTFKTSNSPNNIHFVTCSDCHSKRLHVKQSKP